MQVLEGLVWSAWRGKCSVEGSIDASENRESVCVCVCNIVSKFPAALKRLNRLKTSQSLSKQHKFVFVPCVCVWILSSRQQ